MNLKQIVDNLRHPFEICRGNRDLAEIHIDDIAIDSKKVKENSIFFGIIGKKNDGANFVPEAVNKGCAVSVISLETKFDYKKFIIENPHHLIILGNVHQLLVEILNIYYNSLPKNIYAVTGTNGKTSTVEFIRQILGFIDIKSASIGTLGVMAGNALQGFEESSLTTPDIVSLYKNLAFLKKNNIDDVALEVSSIGLEQGRVDGLNIAGGSFTNFTQDHLDYHQNMDDYFACKMILFNRVVARNGFAVVNADIAQFADIKKICQNSNLAFVDYGFKAQIIKIINISSNSTSSNNEKPKTKVDFIYNNKNFTFNTSLKGNFQIYNMLCALGNVVTKHKLNDDKIAEILTKFDGLEPAVGRMQLVGEYRGAKIFVDFAHTPDALENVLKLARQIAQKRVVILFGCGGDRDSKKRPIMGKIASDLADFLVITDDNPRTENPQIIRQQIMVNCDPSRLEEVGDRKTAITKAIQILREGDILIIAGKGHENYQIIGSQKFEFNEQKIVTDVIKQLS